MNLHTLKDKLLNDHLTIIAQLEDGQLYFSTQRGIAPVLNKIQEDANFFKQAVVIDKVVGKAAAMLFVKVGVKYVYALTMSDKAVTVLEINNISYEYDNRCDYIENRTHTGMCPMEKTVENINNLEEAYLTLMNKVRELKNLGGSK